MKNVLCLCVVAAVALPSYVSAEEKQVGQPHKGWWVGDSWVVREWVPSVGPGLDRMAPVQYKFSDDWTDDVVFRVIDRKEVRGIECFEIEELSPANVAGTPLQPSAALARNVPRMPGRKLLYYSCDTGVPVRVTFTGGGPSGKESLNHDFSLNPDEPDIPLGVECYVFPVWNKDNVEPKTVGPARRRAVSQEKATAENDPDIAHFLIKERIWYKEGSISLGKEIRQTWKRGEPWWHEMTVYQYGGLQFKAALLPETVGAPNNQPKVNRPK